MAEEEKEQTEEAKTAKKGNIVKLALFGLAGLVVVSIIGGIGFIGYQLLQMQKILVAVSGGKQMAQPQKVTEEKKESGEEGEKATPKEKVVHLDPFVVNLLDEGGRRYLKVTVDLVVDSSAVSKEIEDRMPEVRDQIIMCLSNKSFNEIADITGKMHLRQEIKRKLNALLQEGKVLRVLFTEFVVQ